MGFLDSSGLFATLLAFATSASSLTIAEGFDNEHSSDLYLCDGQAALPLKPTALYDPVLQFPPDSQRKLWRKLALSPGTTQ